MARLEKEFLLFGRIEPETLGAYHEFFPHACDIYKRLGKRNHLLVAYVRRLLETAQLAMAYSITLSGAAAANILREMCLGIVNDKPEHTEHPFYQRARDYIQSNPVNITDSKTKAAYYCTALCDRYINAALIKYLEQLWQDAANVMTAQSLNLIGDEITRRLKDDTAIQTLDELFAKRFLIAPHISTFTQEITTRMMYWLTEKDPAAYRQVFQFLLDEEATP